jgi:hypothetical protein
MDIRCFEATPLDVIHGRAKSTNTLFIFDVTCLGGLISFQQLEPEVLQKSLKNLIVLHPVLQWRIEASLCFVKSSDDAESALPITFARTNQDFAVIRASNYVHRDLFEALQLIPKRETDVTFVVRATYFPCGSVILGVSLCHAAFDGAALHLLMCRWSALARGCSVQLEHADEERPALVRGSYANAELPSDYRPSWFKPDQHSQQAPDFEDFAARLHNTVHVTARVLRSALQAVKAVVIKRMTESGNESGVAAVSQFTVLAAVLWRATIRARLLSGRCSASTSTVLSSAVNVRRKLGLPDTFVGNAVANTSSICASADELLSQPLHKCVADVVSGLKTGSDPSTMAKDLLWLSRWTDKAALSAELARLRKVVHHNMHRGEHAELFFNGQHRFLLQDLDFGGRSVPAMRCTLLRPNPMDTVILLPQDVGLDPAYLWLEASLPAAVARLLSECLSAEGDDCAGLGLEVFTDGERLARDSKAV